MLILDFTRAGSQFLLGNLVDTNSIGYIFAFQVLPTIIFFSALTSLLFYLGVIQVIVRGMAWALSKLLNISGAESLSVTGNIFLGQTEAPLMIKAYLAKMTRSEILLVMIGGMATVAGGVMAAYIQYLGGDDPQMRLLFARHLLAASVMAAPGAIVVSKMLCPQTEQFSNDSHVSMENVGSNVLDAIANGTTEGLKLAANVAAMLLVFVAFIAMINYFFNWVGYQTHLNNIIASNTPYNGLSLEMILGTVFSPVMWLAGIAKEDVMLMGQLLGIKLSSSEFVAYTQLAALKDMTSAPHLMYNKSIIMATYMLCGYANFDWTYQNAVQTIDVNTPLGNTVGQLCQDSEGVLAVDSKGKVYQAETAEELSRQLLGFALPVQYLHIWADGRRVANAPYKILPDGRLEQFDWTISRTLNSSGQPKTLQLENAKFNIRLVFDTVNHSLDKNGQTRCAARK